MSGPPDLVGLLEEAQARGLTGPGPVEPAIEHARSWAAGLVETLGGVPSAFLDLGSGGGLPGLVLAKEWPGARATLLDARRRSGVWLREAVVRLALGSRVKVVEARAEAAGREPELRETFPLVLARGFAGPAVTAECGSAFVAAGGHLSVSEPPGGDAARWPAEGLARVGLRLAGVRVAGPASFAVLEKTGPLDEAWPRPVGRPGRKPLWS